MQTCTRITILILAGISLIVFLWKEQYVYALILAVFFLLFEQLARLLSLKLTATSFEIALTDKLGPSKAKQVEAKIADSIKRFEDQSGRKLTKSAKEYVYDVIKEGFLNRQSEMREKYGIDPDDADQVDAVVGKFTESLERLLQEAEPTPAKEVTISKFTEPIRKHYCQVPPFCG